MLDGLFDNVPRATENMLPLGHIMLPSAPMMLPLALELRPTGLRRHGIMGASGDIMFGPLAT